MSELVTTQLADGVATITLNRPEAGNAMSWQLIEEFTQAAGHLTAQPGVRAFLIRAEGKNFCVGGDIRAFASEADPADFIGRLARLLHEGLAKLAAHDAPVITAIQGAAAGAGISLAASGDIVLAADSASFSMAYTGIGLTADGGATWLLPRLIGLRATQELAYLGRRLNAQEAADLGLVTRVVAADKLGEEAAEMARTIAAGPTAAFGGIKRLLEQTNRTGLVDQMEAEAAAISTAMATSDARGAITAFLDRSKQTFTGS